VSLGSRDWRGVSLSATLRELSSAAVVYHLWLQRNGIRHCNTPRSEDQILNAVIWDTKHRVN
jgi:hypothetical protein